MAHRLFGHEVSLEQVQMPRLPVEAPTKYMQNLIPRLTQTIKDIDELQFRIGWGAQEGMMDNWSSLLTAYSILLTRIQAISTSFGQAAIIAKPQEIPPAIGAEQGTSTSVAAAAPLPVPLSRILLHPRLPQTTDTNEFLTMIALTTQQPFPAVKQAQDELIKSTSESEEEGGETGGTQGKDEDELEVMLASLKQRLERENGRASLVADYIRGLEDDYQWQGRIDDDEEEDEDEETNGAKAGGAGQPIDVDVDMETGNRQSQASSRAKWTLDDWVRYRETGKEPHA